MVLSRFIQAQCWRAKHQNRVCSLRWLLFKSRTIHAESCVHANYISRDSLSLGVWQSHRTLPQRSFMEPDAFQFSNSFFCRVQWTVRIDSSKRNSFICLDENENVWHEKIPLQVYPLSLLELTDRGQAWLEKFQKLLSLKYDSLHRRYASASHDYNVLLRENNVDVCTLTTMSGVQKTCSISIVLREATSDHSVEKHVALVEQTTEAMLADAAYQLWIESF